MDFLISFLNTVLPILYFTATYLYALYFFREEEFAARYMTRFLRVTAALHFFEVFLRGIYYRHYPLANLYEAATVLALAITLIYLYIEYRIQVKTTGYFILVFVFFLQLFSSAFISFGRGIPEILQSPFFIFHTTAAILGYSALAISAMYGIMYLLLFHDIKSSRFGVIYSRLPSLEVLSEMNIKAAILGFSFLTVAILLGGVWSYMLFHKLFNPDPKIIIALITWLVYGLVILGSKRLGWTGKRVAFLSLMGFGIILFSMVAMNLFLNSFHVFR